VIDPPASAHVAAFDCEVCGVRAMRLILPTETAPPGEEGDVHVQGPGFLELQSDLGQTFFAVSGGKVPPDGSLLEAFAEGEPEAFYRLNLEFVPNWCPRCPRLYCRDHWRVWEVFDPDDPAWHEETRGECPNGHERMLAD
jgi:hypothetical protein